MSRLILKICIDKFKSLPRDENGAAMMITLAVVLFLYLLCSSTYAIGMTINEKIQLQNAADAAAYSAAVVEADGLSRIATINRAMSWTYIQTVKRRMDYIVLEWLNLTKTNFDEDRKRCQEFNSKQYKVAQQATLWGPYYSFSPQSCETHCGERGPGRWWVGWTEGDEEESCGQIRLGYVENSNQTTQAGRFISYKGGLEDIASEYKNQKEILTNYMDQEKDILERLTALMTKEIYDIPQKIEIAALDILKRNLPKQRGEEYYCRILLPNFSYPYPSDGEAKDLLQSIFSPYRNTEEDELEFIATSVKNSSLHDVFGDGIDQWFIREKPSSLETDQINVSVDVPANYVMRGIQRGYKNANRSEASKVLGTSRGNHVAYGNSKQGSLNAATWASSFAFPVGDGFKTWPIGNVPTGIIDGVQMIADYLTCYSKILQNASRTDIIPSCLNSSSNFIEHCLNEKNNYGLVAEYHWSALRWWCGTKILFAPVFPAFKKPRLDFVKDFGMVHYKVSSIASCDHETSNVINNTRSSYEPCFIGADMSTTNSHIANNFVTGSGTMGYTRIYGDDKRIYNDKTKDYYITPKVMPVKLNHSFFQERINVAVGKKQKNPFYWLFSSNNEQRAVAPNDSIFALFNPTLFSGNNTNGMIVATSSATAAFRSRRYAGHYETNYDQITSFEYDNQYDSDIPTISLDINVQTPGISKSTIEKLRLGCPHKSTTNKISERLSKVWNLCETDWQAVFVPHRYADENWIGHQKKDGIFGSYDSVRSNSDTWYRSYPQELSINSNFLISLGFPNEKGEYLKPLYDTSKGNGRFNVRHPALRNEPSKDFSSEELGLFLLKFKLQ